MIRLEVRKIGDALGIVLPQEAIRALDAVEGTTLHLTAAPGGGYLLSPADADVERSRSSRTSPSDTATRFRTSRNEREHCP